MNENDKLQPSESAMETARRMGPPAADVSEIAQWLASQPRSEFGALPQALLDAIEEDLWQTRLAQHWADTRPEWVTTGDLREEELHRYLAAREAKSAPQTVTQPGLLQDSRHLVRQANERLSQLGWQHRKYTTITGRATQKLDYESQVHPKSRDWDGAVLGAREFYETVHAWHANGEDMSVSRISSYQNSSWTLNGMVDHDVKAICAWLSSPEHPLLASQGGQIVFISNHEKDLTPISEENPDGMTPAELLDERYPGWKLDMRNPLAGRSWTAWTHVLVAERVYQEIIKRGGQDVETDEGLRKLKRLSSRDVARIMNSEEFRSTDPRLQELRAAGINQGRLALKRMREAWLHMFGGTDDNGNQVNGCDDCVEGQLHLYQVHVAKDGERYMKEHGFVAEPPAYACGPEPEDRREERLQRRAIRRQAREARQGVELYNMWTSAH